jgi:hypothetical protein
VIWESGPWRRELLHIASRIEKRKTFRRWPEAAVALLERDVMLGAYSVRKLIEAQTKAPHSVRDQQIQVQVMPATPGDNGEIADLMNWHHVDRWFDLGRAERTTMSVSAVCNQIIHSWVFMPLMDADTGGLHSIFVCSDRHRAHSLYQVAADSLVDLFRQVGQMDVTELRMTRDMNGQWVIEHSVYRDPDHDDAAGRTDEPARCENLD